MLWVKLGVGGRMEQNSHEDIDVVVFLARYGIPVKKLCEWMENPSEARANGWIIEVDGQSVKVEPMAG